jgi:acyl-CoA synthetase (AMP-forming)/AMP-acid ligase II/acyl carrier protein
VLLELEKVFRVPVVEAYGMTETATLICSNRLPPSRRLPGSVGPTAGPRVEVLDDAHRPLPPGVCGEVAISGENVTPGYEGDVTGWVTGPTGERWFLSGDEGVFDIEGRLVLTGRRKEMINRGGKKVIPRRVDEALLRHPAVKQAVAFSVPHPTLGEDLAAAVVLRGGVEPDEKELRRHALRVLAPHEVPSRILFLKALPRGAAGKLQRIGLAERLGDLLRPSEEPVCGELEQLIATTVAEVLQQTLPGRDANFFQLGGDSLAGMRVISRLSEHLCLDLHPNLLFAFPTPRSLAGRLDQLLDEAVAQLEGTNP